MSPAVAATLGRLTGRLLAARNPHGHWTGQLASSALSTALASIALPRSPLVEGGLDWLERTQNADGGWGDTTLSISNISTTALCWAAFTLRRASSPAAGLAREYMGRAAGSLEPGQLSEAIARRYGSDHTFSVPILTVLAVAGHVPWSHVPQLPFELAACPQSWFRWLGLPVVSYALPALIAIGHLRHRRAPSWNPLARATRLATAGTTLDVLGRIQPENGGFLEATPLTSFVAISLREAGYLDSPVLAKCLGFLETSVQPDGSWPIDTNLATWCTTLSVNALGDRLPVEARPAIRQWLVGQQYRRVHPYTGAPPGGWAWTDLPGGVPDADDTAGALVALAHLGETPLDSVVAAIEWLLQLQNRDGGIPTFCRGWGKLPFDRSSPDLSAHALLAFRAWQGKLPPALGRRVADAAARVTRFLEGAQQPDGSWIPLWFGCQHHPNDENPVYGTARVLIGLAPETSAMAERGLAYLATAQNADGGWGGAPGMTSSIEETSVALHACAAHRSQVPAAMIEKAAQWLVNATEEGRVTPPSPIGFYFARLWYFEELYPLIFSTAALGRIANSSSCASRAGLS